MACMLIHKKYVLWIFQLYFSKMFITPITNRSRKKSNSERTIRQTLDWHYQNSRALCVSQRNSADAPSQFSVTVGKKYFNPLNRDRQIGAHCSNINFSPRLIRFTQQLNCCIVKKTNVSKPCSIVLWMPRAIRLVDESFRAQTPCIKSHITTEFLHRLGVPRTCQKCFFLPFELYTWLWCLWFYWRHSLLEEPRGGQVTRCLKCKYKEYKNLVPTVKMTIFTARYLLFQNINQPTHLYTDCQT